jgi:hypothetical protein
VIYVLVTLFSILLVVLLGCFGFPRRQLRKAYPVVDEIIQKAGGTPRVQLTDGTSPAPLSIRPEEIAADED